MFPEYCSIFFVKMGKFRFVAPLRPGLRALREKAFAWVAGLVAAQNLTRALADNFCRYNILPERLTGQKTVLKAKPRKTYRFREG
jgi:hypothetical protein